MVLAIQSYSYCGCRESLRVMRSIKNLIKVLLIGYLTIVISAFAAGYVFAYLEDIGVIPLPPKDWKDK